VRKLSIATPSAQLVDAYLTEIAKGYGVKWALPETDNKDGNDLNGGIKVSSLMRLFSYLTLPINSKTGVRG
jgi:vacuolar protein sorting-associated protein IST1